MPGLFYERVARRGFLQTTAVATFAALTGGQTPRTFAGESKFHMALLSDTHIPGDRLNGHRGFNPWENLKQIIPEVRGAKPEGVIICGDAARLEGLPQDYEELRGLIQPLAAEAPIFVALGNHDNRANFTKTFPNPAGTRAEVAQKHVLVIESEPVRLIVLDSLLYVNQVAGLLGKLQRAWLEEYLGKNREKPTILFVHHTLKDNDGDLLDADRLFKIVEPHGQVKAIFFGHSHSWSLERHGHLSLINLPAVGYNFRDQDPVGWMDAHFDARGVDLTMHAFAGNRADDGKVTRVEWA